MIHLNRSMMFVLSALVFIGCSSRTLVEDAIVFPADANQPFLTLEDIVESGAEKQGGILPGVKALFLGPRATEHMLRPIASVREGALLYIADADAAMIFVYSLEDGEYRQKTTFGSGELIAPSGIAVWDDQIIVSDASAGRLFKFDRQYKLNGTLEVPEIIRPGQLKVNPHTNELFIVDTPNHYVLSINTKGDVTGRLRHKNTGDQLLGSPMAVDFTADGHIVVLDGLSRRVEIFSSDYLYESGFGGYDRVPGSFSNPKGLAISSDGNIFIADAAFGNIQIFDINGALLYFFGQIGKEAGEFLLPGSLSFDSEDMLFVMDQFNSRIQIFHYLAQGE